jgi:putative GTP pyrophosphokinase
MERADRSLILRRVAISKTAVNRAGTLVRDAIWKEEGRPPPDPAVFEQALLTIVEFRRLHAGPLQRVAVNLRYYVEKHTSSRPITVGQRLKRLPTIVDKMHREPEMKLSRMHDVGGCRAVVATEAEVRAIAGHLRRRWVGSWGGTGARIVREYDYISDPKPDSGYRAIHLVVEKEGRLIEVQLRTLRQHAWAELIELVDRRNPAFNLKGGRAPADLTEYYRLGADLLAAGDRGESPAPEKLLRFRELHEKVSPYTSANPPSNGS